MMTEAQKLVDLVWQDTHNQSTPRFILEHKSFKNLVSLAPRAELTPLLLEMLWDDPNWILLHALQLLHQNEGPVLPAEDNGRYRAICAAWVRWGVARGYLGPTDRPS
jgi:hypothetical protein